MPSIGKFTFATAIDLVMGYYSFELDEEAKQICVITLPWGLYQYNVLSMGLTISSDVFQEALGNLFLDTKFVQVYLDDIIIIGNSSFKEHMGQVEEVLSRLSKMGLQVNPRKSFWARDEVEYLGFIINREGVRPQVKKIQGMLDLKQLSSQKEVRGFIGMANFYRSMWPRRSATLGPLNELTGKSVKF